VFYVQQGTIVKCNEILDNQQDSDGGIRKKRKLFVPLEQLHGEDAATRPYFPVDAIHHTQAWRLMSSSDQCAYVERNKHLLLHRSSFGSDEKELSNSSKGMMQQEMSKIHTTENIVTCGKKNEAEFEDDVQEFGVNQELLQYMSDHSDAQNFSPNDSASSSFDEEGHTWDNSVQSIMKDAVAVQQHHSQLLLSDEIVAMTDL
jgi:hypothetical protein